MPKTLYLLFNHTLTAAQKADAHESLGVDRIEDLPPALKESWRRVPAEVAEIGGYLKPFKKWLTEKARPKDPVLIQGDFGATYIMVAFAFERSLVPVYSTTERFAEEHHLADGTVQVTHHFKHRIFRKYGG